MKCRRKNYGITRYIFMGRAVAANQLEGGWNEGGKGPSVIDVMTGGSATKMREITDGVVKESIIRTMWQWILS